MRGSGQACVSGAGVSLVSHSARCHHGQPAPFFSSAFFALHLCAGPEILKLSRTQQHQCAGVLPGDARAIQLLFQQGRLRAGVEDDPAGPQGQDGVEHLRAAVRPHIQGQGVHGPVDAFHIRHGGQPFDFLPARSDGDDIVSIVHEHAHGLIGIAFGLGTGPQHGDGLRHFQAPLRLTMTLAGRRSRSFSL